MTGAYDCNYDFVDDPMQALVEAHEKIRQLESQHAAEIDRLRLTAEERESLAWAATFIDENYATGAGDTLRNLLARLGGTDAQ